MVYTASDDERAKNLVSQIVRDAGFEPVDWGGLKAARCFSDLIISTLIKLVFYFISN